MLPRRFFLNFVRGSSISSRRTFATSYGKKLFSEDFRSVTAEQTYAEWAESYDADMKHYQFDSIKTCPLIVNNMIVSDYQKNSDNINILDVGCGTGLFGESLIDSFDKRQINIDGFDLTQEMLDVLQKNNADYYDTTLQHDISHKPWPFKSRNYDYVVCNGVLVYVNDNGQCLDEFIRVTKKGGYVILMLRHDGLNPFARKIYELMVDKKWVLKEITDTRYNFRDPEKNRPILPYNHHIFQVL